MQLTEKQVLRIIKGHGRGYVFTTRSLCARTEDSGAVRTALTRLVQKKVIRRLCHGLYDLPQSLEGFGEVPPSVKQIIDAIVKSDAIKVQPTGAYAANLLKLSTQLPVKIDLYTTGPRRLIRAGHLEISLKPTTPKNMIGAGTKAGLILHGLRQIGQPNIRPWMIQTLSAQVTKQDVIAIRKQAMYAPAWIAKIMRNLIADLDH